MAAKRTIRKKKSPLPLLLALVLLLGGGAYYYIQSNEEPVVAKKAAPQRPKGKIAIPVLARDLKRGAEISQRFITIDYLDPEDVPEDAVINLQVFEGRWLVTSLSRGDYIRESDLAERGAPKSYSGMIQTGKRVVILPEGELPGAMGYVGVGDIIDIYTNGTARVATKSSFDPATDGSQPGKNPSANKRAGGSSGGVPKMTIRLVSQAEVLQAPRKTRDGSMANVVLETTEEEAIQLQLARINKEVLRFVFRPSNDPSPGEKLVQRERDPRTVEVIKGLSKRTVLTRLDWRENNLSIEQ